MGAADYTREQRRTNPKLIAMNMAYRILMDHSPALQEEVPLDGLAEDIAAAILRGAVSNAKDGEAPDAG